MHCIVSDDYLYNLTYITEDFNPFPLHSLPNGNSSLHSILDTMVILPSDGARSLNVRLHAEIL